MYIQWYEGCQIHVYYFDAIVGQIDMYSVKVSEQRADDFLKFLQEDRESFIADVAASYNELKTKQIQTQVWIMIIFSTRILLLIFYFQDDIAYD